MNLKQQIKQELTKRGFKPGVRFLSAESGREAEFSNNVSYNLSKDTLYSDNMAVYYKGKWAERIPG